ncbi:MAG: class I SAM-dependent methyltransferase [Rhodospirillales bacterium]
MTTMPLRKHTAVLADYLPQAGRRILDVGCGEGALVRHFARNGAEAVGIDPLAQAIERAEAAEPVPGTSFVLGRGEALPFPDADFDIVCYFNSLHHVPQAVMGQALGEALRVARPEAMIAVLEPVAAGAYFEMMRPINDETEVREQAIAALADFATRPGVRLLEQIDYDSPHSYESFAACEERVLSVDPTRAARLAQHRDEIAASFAATSERDEKGRYLFRQPSRLALFAKED